MNLNRAVLLLLLLSGSVRAQSYYELSGPLPTYSSQLESWTLTPDGARVVFERVDDSGARGVFSAPLDGEAAVALTAALPGKSQGFALSPDGSRVVVLTRPGSSSVRRLHAVPTAGGAPVLLSASTDTVIHSFQISPSSLRVVYLANTTPSGYELWSALLDGSAPPVRLNAPLPAGRTLTSGYRLSHGGQLAFYTADQDADEVYDLYSVRTDGSQPPVRLNTSQPWADVSGYQLSFDSLSVVYRADQDTDGKLELYVTSTLGGVTPARRSGALVAGGNVTSFQLAAASHRLVFLADAEVDERFELYALDPTVPGMRVKLSGSLASDRDVLDARVSADGLCVAYRSNQDVVDQIQLFGVPATGGAILELNGPLAAGESILADYALESLSGRVLFHGDMGVPASYGARQLYSAPLDGSQAALRLNGELVERGVAALLEAGPEGALFTATEVANEAFLFRAPLAGGGAPLRLSPPLPAGSIVVAARFAAGGSRVVFEAADELFAVPSVGGVGTRIQGSRVDSTRPYGTVRDVTSDREHAVYVGVQAPARTSELFSVRLDGSEEPRRLGRASSQASGSLVLSGDGQRVLYLTDAHGLAQLCSARLGVADSEVVLASDAAAFDGNEESVTDFVLAPDGDSVVYALASGGSLSVRHGPLDGSQPAEELTNWPDAAARLQCSPDGNWIVLAGPAGLYSHPVDGHQPAQRLDSGAADFPSVVLTSDSSRVVFATGEAGGGLFSAPLDGSQPAIQLGTGTIPTLELTHDGTGVLFLADGDQVGGPELYRAALDGGTPTSLLGGSYVQLFQEDPISGLVVFYDSVSELLSSVPVQGGVAPTTLASTRLAPLGESPVHFAGGRVIYLGYQVLCDDHGEITRLYSVPVVGGAAPSRLDFGSCSVGVFARVEPCNLDRNVMFVAQPDRNDEIGLYRAPINGSAPARRLAGPRWLQNSFHGSSDKFELTRDGGYLLCRTEAQTSPAAFQLHALRLGPRARPR